MVFPVRTLPPGPRLQLAVAASAAYPDLRPDWPLLRDALADMDVDASTQVWTDPAVPWHEFALVVANGAWDNIHHPEDFLAWARRVADLTRIVNAPHVLRWNLDKRYLATLAAAGVATVPTTWLEPPGSGSGARSGSGRGVDTAVIEFQTGEFVVKPAISGGGYETARYAPGESEIARTHILRLLDAGRTVMVQPYQAAVDTQGEVGLIFLGSEFSHAIAKGPLLRPASGIGENLWGHEEINAVAPTESQRATAQVALDAAEHLVGPTTYARVDLVSGADGSPAVLELELLDPALFFETQPSAATRFARVLRGLMP